MGDLGGPGLLVALEGGPGSGTAEQALLLRQSLDGAGVPAELAQPDGEGAWLVPQGGAPPRWPAVMRVPPFLFRLTELADTWQQAVAPALAAGSVVIVDRYRLTLLAHAGARRLDVGWAGRVAEALPHAHVSIYLRSDPARQLDRLLRAGTALRDWEHGVDASHGPSVGAAFRAYQTAVAREFESLVSGDGPHVLTLDGDAAPPELQRHIRDAVIAGLEAME